MKKRLFLFVLVAVIAAGALSAWEPNDLVKFPSGIEDGTWIINFGAGLYIPGSLINAYIPAIHLSVDRSTGLGEQKLPFFFGGLFGYSGEGYTPLWFVHKITIGGRFGYHFNWGVDKLDTYAVTTAGVIIHTGNFGNRYNGGNWVLFGVNVGARYFFTDWFGLWAEAGYTSFSLFDIGVAFKF